MKRRTIEGECAMTLSQLLDIRPGVTAVIGGGGKTTLLRTLGEELAGQHPPRFSRFRTCPAPGQRRSWTNCAGRISCCVPGQTNRERVS